MQLLSSRTRLLLMLAIWLIALGVLVFWLASTKLIRVTIAGGPANSETLGLSTAIANVLNKNDAGFTVSVFESGGSRENIALLQNSRIDFATIQADTPVSDDIASVATLYNDAYHLIARNGTGIKSFSDLPGHRVAIPPESSGQNSSFWFLAAHYGLTRGSLNALPMGGDAANFAMEQGQVDAIFRVRAPGNATIRGLIGDKQLHLVPIIQSQALALKQPAISAGTIPMGSYRGSPALPESDMATAVVDRLMVARADMDAGLVYKITKAIYESRSEILLQSKLAGFIGPPPDDAKSVITVHAGARSYFDREKPGFLQQNARLVSAMLYMLAIVSSGLLALRTFWVRSRRMRMHTFNQNLLEISRQARQNATVDELLGRKHELMDMLAGVVTDLEREKVSQNEFEHFSFAWQAVDALVRDRLLLIQSGVVAAPAPEVSA